MAGSETLLFADCVTSLGAIELEPELWGVDYCASCTQKGLAAPPGMSPIAASARAVERIAARTSPASFNADLLLLADYWTKRPPTYHHTAPILHIYALHEALRLALAEGWDARLARHADAGAHFQAGLRDRGLETVADPAHQLPQLTAIRVPDGVDAALVQRRLLRDHRIEVGGGLGPTAPPMWRVGLMGENATRETADRLLDAFDAVLA
jgi:alanine-glyoxylate transaminase/serine-glyoxylate transaminase/serine-pyruvate transaminase